MSPRDHGTAPPARVRGFVLTISDTRTLETDTSGRAIAELLEAAGHAVAGRALVTDDPSAVRAALVAELDGDRTDVIIATGGTGIAPRDRTSEVVSALLDTRLDGFGELFRVLSYQEVGAVAMLSRATAGVARGKLVFALPGAEGAVRLAMTRLILPALGHLVAELHRGPAAAPTHPAP
jgi:molybdenum cofactor biosynthesis protein B